MVEDQQGDKSRKELRNTVNDFQNKLERCSYKVIALQRLLKITFKVYGETHELPFLHLKEQLIHEVKPIKMSCSHSRLHRMKSCKRRAKKHRMSTYLPFILHNLTLNPLSVKMH